MGVITISRGSYSKGKEIAEQLAQNLGYQCVSRDILLETSTHFNVPEAKLIRAIHDAPSFFDRFAKGKERYVNFIRKAFLEYIINDNIVYHGLAGHFFIKDVPNVLKIRIISNIEDRVKEEMERENISEQKARHLLMKDDDERRKWSMHLYGIDTKDPNLYDIVIHIDNLSVSDAVETLTDVAKRPCFQSTQRSQRIIKDYYLAAKAEVILFEKIPSFNVKCKNAVIYVSIETDLSLEEDMILKVNNALRVIDDVKEVRVNVIPFGTDG